MVIFLGDTVFFIVFLAVSLIAGFVFAVKEPKPRGSLWVIVLLALISGIMAAIISSFIQYAMSEITAMDLIHLVIVIVIVGLTLAASITGRLLNKR